MMFGALARFIRGGHETQGQPFWQPNIATAPYTYYGLGDVADFSLPPVENAAIMTTAPTGVSSPPPHVIVNGMPGAGLNYGTAPALPNARPPAYGGIC